MNNLVDLTLRLPTAHCALGQGFTSISFWLEKVKKSHKKHMLHIHDENGLLSYKHYKHIVMKK